MHDGMEKLPQEGSGAWWNWKSGFAPAMDIYRQEDWKWNVVFCWLGNFLKCGSYFS
jgi:hypothetical protein